MTHPRFSNVTFVITDAREVNAVNTSGLNDLFLDKKFHRNLEEGIPHLVRD